MDKRIVGIVCGTRPEIIKLAPVYHALRRHQGLCVLWVHTGQHGDMAADMLRCFGIEPDVQLARKGASLEEFSLECRAQLDALMAKQRWDLCIVQGDTESAFLGALSAFYRRVPVGHVEAGLRTYNLERPFPEEGLRQMISRIANVHWAPTERARAALVREGIEPEKILLTGNTVVDAQQWICARHGIRREGAPGAGHVLVTAHRRENWGDDMEQTFHAVADIARAHPARRVLFPVHLNPVVQRPAHAILQGLENVRLAAPLDYLGMQQALVNASLLLTDSGGLQEEAPTFGVPTLVLRHETERPEAVEAGCARLVGPRRDAIVEHANRLLSDEVSADAMRKVANPFGDGHAAHRIAQDVFARLAVAAALACAGAAFAQVTPPPLPPGSNLVRAEPGMAEPERKRHVRAHHHKFHHKKDYTRDDSVHGHESQAMVRTGGQGAAGSGAPGAATVPGAAAGAGPNVAPAAPRTAAPVGGAGTGPAREKTDRGASSYFHGNDKK